MLVGKSSGKYSGNQPWNAAVQAPADAAAKPAEDHASGRGADEKDRHNYAEPLDFESRLRRDSIAEHVFECVMADERKQSDLEAVKHPTEESGKERRVPWPAAIGIAECSN
jgi:hypothetical protein